MSETLAYDALNRLTSSSITGSTSLSKTFSYDPIGNMLLKSDVGTYTYPAAASARPHGVTSISGGSISTTFTYDADGNQTSGLGRSLVYTSYNKPSSITQGARTISFLDDTEHQRFKQVTPEGTTLYISGFGVLAELNNPGATSAKWTDYVSVGNVRVGMRVNASGTLTWLYFKTDHLGSISVLTSGGGAVVQHLSYDAWGKRRNPNGTDDTTGSITSQATRGFTGEEELSVAGLIHLNGRVYDPILARFTSADPTVTDPLNPQDWNRYSYVGNDPLTFTDPNGFDFFGDFFGGIADFFTNVFDTVTNFFATNPIARAILQVGATLVISAILGPEGALATLGLNAGGVAAVAAFGGAAIATGLSGGNLGQVLKAGVIAGATAFAFAGLGVVTPASAAPLGSAAFNPGNYAANVAGSAAIGCLSSVASGGSCASGAAAAAVGSALSPITNSVFPQAQSNLGERIGGTLVQATAGGLASVAGGGKFANGAVTAGFQYLATVSLESATEASRKDPMDSLDADFRPGAVQHILDRHGDPYAQSLDPRAGQFTQEYSNPAALNELADQVIGSPDASVKGNGDNTMYFGAVFWRDNDTGRTFPALVGMTGASGGRASMPTNLVAVVVNPTGQVVTMFPTDSSYAASRGAILP
jgi:RHS repeat-associated protein